jgi:hypothetical protein
MEDRLDLKSRGGELSIFHAVINWEEKRLSKVGIYVKDDDGPAVFYADKGEVRRIIFMLEKLIEDK